MFSRVNQFHFSFITCKFNGNKATKLVAGLNNYTNQKIVILTVASAVIIKTVCIKYWHNLIQFGL